MERESCVRFFYNCPFCVLHNLQKVLTALLHSNWEYTREEQLASWSFSVLEILALVRRLCGFSMGVRNEKTQNVGVTKGWP